MQRAGAGPHTPKASPSGPPSKRVRLSDGTASPVTPSSALQDALDAEESQRLKALEKHAEAMGETRWVLSVQEQPRTSEGTVNIVTAGFGDIDALSDDEEPQPQSTQGMPQTHGAPETPVAGRRVFGKMKRQAEGQPDESSDSEDTSSSDGEDDDDPAAQLIRAERKEAAAQAREKRRAKRKAEKAESDRLATERRKKEVRLNKLTSISGGGGSKSASRSGASTPSRDITCYKCGKQGHTKALCPS